MGSQQLFELCWRAACAGADDDPDPSYNRAAALDSDQHCLFNHLKQISGQSELVEGLTGSLISFTRYSAP